MMTQEELDEFNRNYVHTKAREEGLTEGRAEGRTEAQLEAIQCLMETTNVNFDDACKMLKINPEEKEVLKKRI